MIKGGYVYILTNEHNGTLYIGGTNSLVRRIDELKSRAVDGFTKKYGVNRLVWYEQHDSIEQAILREKR